MQVGLVGLGRMGGNMARRLLNAGHEVVALDRDPAQVKPLARAGAVAAHDWPQLVKILAPPRVVWLMLPAGATTGQAVQDACDLLDPGDVLVDGANSYYRDSVARAQTAAERGIHFVDAGVSGGIWGLEQGYGLMLGGDPGAISIIKPLLQALAPTPETGWVHVGSAGAGHYAKMVHNGIEYALMAAYAEGIELLRRKTEFSIDVGATAEAWRHGTVIRSWLLDLIAGILRDDPELREVAPIVMESGEGRWCAREAIDLGVAAPLITLALHDRFQSQDAEGYPRRLLARLRQSFGGHAVEYRAKKPDAGPDARLV